MGEGAVLIAGGNDDTPQNLNRRLVALDSARSLTLETLDSQLMVPFMTMPRANPISGQLDDAQVGYIAGGLVYDGRTDEDQYVVTPLTGIEFSAEARPPGKSNFKLSPERPVQRLPQRGFWPPRGSSPWALGCRHLQAAKLA